MSIGRTHRRTPPNDLFETIKAGTSASSLSTEASVALGVDGVVGRTGSKAVLPVLCRWLDLLQQLRPSVSVFSFASSIGFSLSRRPNWLGGSGRDVASARHVHPEEEIAAEDHNNDTSHRSFILQY